MTTYVIPQAQIIYSLIYGGKMFCACRFHKPLKVDDRVEVGDSQDTFQIISVGTVKAHGVAEYHFEAIQVSVGVIAREALEDWLR